MMNDEWLKMIASVMSEDMDTRLKPVMARIAELEAECKALRALIAPPLEARLEALESAIAKRPKLIA